MNQGSLLLNDACGCCGPCAFFNGPETLTVTLSGILNCACFGNEGASGQLSGSVDGSYELPLTGTDIFGNGVFSAEFDDIVVTQTGYLTPDCSGTPSGSRTWGIFITASCSGVSVFLVDPVNHINAFQIFSPNSSTSVLGPYSNVYADTSGCAGGSYPAYGGTATISP